jgi:hypothetical protein
MVDEPEDASAKMAGVFLDWLANQAKRYKATLEDEHSEEPPQ